MKQFTLYNLKALLHIQKQPLLYYVTLINKSIFLIVNLTKVKMKYHYFLPLFIFVVLILLLAAELLRYTNYKPSEIISDQSPSYSYGFV